MKKNTNLIIALMLTMLCCLSFLQPATAASGFKITRLQLYFNNQRPEIVIDKNSSSLKAYVDITLKGSGLLQGFWEVDGRNLANVSRHIGTDQTIITLETPDLPSLPTFESGVHRLRFVVTSPALATILPEAIYYVAGEAVTPLPIKLLTPQDQATIPFTSTIFRWEGKRSAASYLITFYSAGDKPVFSAYTRDIDYQLSDSTLNNLFLVGHEYSWKIISYGTKQNRIGASETYKLTFKVDNTEPGSGQ